jgi:hypothetical protein
MMPGLNTVLGLKQAVAVHLLLLNPFRNLPTNRELTAEVRLGLGTGRQVLAGAAC